MGNFLGWLISVLVTLVLFIKSGILEWYLDQISMIFVLGAIYGISIVIFGVKQTLESIYGVKYLFLASSKSPQLANIYKTQMQISILVAVIGVINGALTFLSTINDPKGIGPAIALALVTAMYVAILSVFLYLPLYKKLS